MKKEYNEPQVVPVVDTPDAKEMEKLLSEEKERQAIQEALATLQVKQSGVPFDAHESAQNNMTSVLAIANWQFNKNISVTLKNAAGLPTTDEVTKAMLEGLASIFDGLYDLTYKTKIGWKGADNKPHAVQAETVAKALYKAMRLKSKILGVNNVKK